MSARRDGGMEINSSMEKADGDFAATEEFDELGATDDLEDLGLWLDRKTWT
jgi:hypothetical protein